jgi:hypothetical protein
MEGQKIIVALKTEEVTVFDILPSLTEMERQTLIEKASKIEVRLNGYRAILAGWKMQKASIATVQFYGGMAVWLDWETALIIVEKQEGEFLIDRSYWNRWGTGAFLEIPPNRK